MKVLILLDVKCHMRWVFPFLFLLFLLGKGPNGFPLSFCPFPFLPSGLCSMFPQAFETSSILVAISIFWLLWRIVGLLMSCGLILLGLPLFLRIFPLPLPLTIFLGRHFQFLTVLYKGVKTPLFKRTFIVFLLVSKTLYLRYFGCWWLYRAFWSWYLGSVKLLLKPTFSCI